MADADPVNFGLLQDVRDALEAGGQRFEIRAWRAGLASRSRRASRSTRSPQPERAMQALISSYLKPRMSLK